MGSRAVTARRAGLLYLVMSVIMIFGFMYAPAAFLVNGDAAATARKITEGALMYRVTVLASLVGQILFVFVVLTLYQLFRDVDRHKARLMVTLVCVAVAAELGVIANRLSPFDYLSGSSFLSVFPRQELEALMLNTLYVGANLALILQAFWGLWLIPFGMLTIQSGFLPKILGVFLIVAGVGYMATCVGFLILPDQLPTIRRWMMPLYFGEVPIIFWLLIKGAKEPQTAA